MGKVGISLLRFLTGRRGVLTIVQISIDLIVCGPLMDSVSVCESYSYF
jgi:hypothetical protein